MNSHSLHIAMRNAGSLLFFLLAAFPSSHALAVTDQSSEGFTVSDAGPGWTFEFEYPPIETELCWVRAEVMEDIQEIKADFSTLAEHEFAAYGEDEFWIDWFMEGSMTLVPAPEGYMTVSASWWDFSGGAHGNEGALLYRFARSVQGDGTFSWEEIGTEDLLADSAELVELSRLVVDTLAARLGLATDRDWIMEGAGPEWGNYSLLRPVPDSTGALAGFSTLFPSYRVAPYACGPQEVFIPIGLLRP
jgi:hypothetical protein